MPFPSVFYLDPDDEIPSLVSRMKSVEESFLVFVIPHRSVLFSSAITLRMLKKEADRLEKDIFLVTQDEQGFDMAKRMGFIVRKTLEELPFTFPRRESESPHTERLETISSSSKNYSDDVVHSERSKVTEIKNSFRGNSAEEVGSLAWGTRQQGTVPFASQTFQNRTSVAQKFVPSSPRRAGQDAVAPKKIEQSQIHHNSNQEISFSSEEKNDVVGSRSKWIIIVSFLLLLGMMAGVILYIQSPEATIIIHPQSQDVSGDVSYDAGADREDVQVLFLEYEQDVRITSSATGRISGSGSKARGTVTFYNFYSKEEQPLVATTRLLSPDGKIFRLVKSTVIPGFTEKEGSVEPGTIKVEVQADASGSEYNIDPTKFTIPGFSSDEKREKIYAESQDAMNGGGSNENVKTSVSQDDISGAQKKAQEEVVQTILQKAKTDLSSGVTSEDLIEIVFLEKNIVPSVGTVAETFDFTARAKVRYAVFSDEDVGRVALQTLAERDSSLFKEGRSDSVKTDYGKITVDFNAKIVNIKVFVSGSLSPEIPVEEIRDDILGKNENELQEIVEKYPQVKSFEVELRKAYFQKKIPSNREKVFIRVE